MRLNEISDDLLEKYKNDISSALHSDVRLYRGIKNMLGDPPGAQSIQSIRRDRQLLNSSRISGFVFDTYMQLKKWPFRKSNTASITLDPRETFIYGATCRVYPFNGTWYLYSTVAKDFMLPADSLVRSIYNKLQVEFKLPSYSRVHADLLMAYPDEIEKLLAASLDKIDQQLDFHATMDVNELKYAAGEILMWGPKQFIAVRMKIAGDN